MLFQPFWITRVLKVLFWPFLGQYGPFWALLGQNWGHPQKALLAPIRAILGIWGQKTAHRAAKRAYTGKPKVPIVTSGYGEVTIPFGSVWGQKCGLYGRSVEKNWFLPQKGPFLAIGARKWPAQQPNGHLPENQRYPELPQDMGNIWSHWIRFV